MNLETFTNLAIALGLGLLVGLQREWVDKKVAGIRTFSLIALFGALCGLLSVETPIQWMPAAGLIVVAAMFWIGNAQRGDAANPGVTTEIAGLVTFVVGVIVMLGMGAVAVVTSGTMAVLLHWKRPLHQLVDRIGEDDFRAIVRLVLIGMVILPVLPNHPYGPYDVLNPFKIWLMVVLIVGISLAAYAAQRLLGNRVGTLLAGVLGGLISSTATTISYARRARTEPAASDAAAIIVMAASTIVFARVMLEVAVAAPSQFSSVVPPLGAMMAFMLLITAGAFVRWRSRIETPARDHPPSDLSAAVTFGLLYAGVLFAVAAVKQSFGDPGMYVVAALSGLTDMDAITLSTAQLMESGNVGIATGWRLILVGAIANLAFKAGAVAALGSPVLLGRILLLFGLSAAGGVALLMFWP